MKPDLENNFLVERLRNCPKLECNFLFRRLYNPNDDVSEMTCEESDFWKREASEELHFAAKRFKNSVSLNHDLSNSLPPTALYDEDRLVEPIRCSSDETVASSDYQLPDSPPKISYKDLTFLHSSFFHSDDFDMNRRALDERQANGAIPKLEPISDKENSFSTSSADMVFTKNFGQNDFDEGSFNADVGIDKLHEQMLPHGISSLPHVSRDQDEINKFSDVMTAKSLNLYIDEYPQTSFFSLLDSLQSNSVIERIEVFRKRTTNEEIRTRTIKDMDSLFHVIHNLSTLAELVLWNFHPKDLSSLCLGIVDNMSIKYLQLHMECGTLDQQAVEIISSMPSLLSLELEVNESFPLWSLLESNSLVLLGVFSACFDFDPNDVLRLSGRIRTNSVLRVLDLEPRIPSWCIGAVMASLRFSHTSQLETFRFSCRNDNKEQGDACMAEILKTIEYETSLRVLWNYSCTSFSVSEEMRRRTMLAVNRNPSLKEFRLFAKNGE